MDGVLAVTSLQGTRRFKGHGKSILVGLEGGMHVADAREASCLIAEIGEHFKLTNVIYRKTSSLKKGRAHIELLIVDEDIVLGALTSNWFSQGELDSARSSASCAGIEEAVDHL